MFRQNINSNLTLLAALIFFWMFLGQLVNFHQVHVLGKELPTHSIHFLKPKSDESYAIVNDPGLIKTVKSNLDILVECSSWYSNQVEIFVPREEALLMHQEFMLAQNISSLPPPVC